MIKFSDNQNTRKISEAEYEYDAFGATVSQSGMMADTFRHRFSTKPWIAALGAYDYGERVYSPELRRWLSRDPIEEEGGANLYAMCGNDAVNLVDMLGMSDGFSSAIQQDKFIKIESKIAKYKKPWYRYVFKSPFLDIDISAKNKIKRFEKCGELYSVEYTIIPAAGRSAFNTIGKVDDPYRLWDGDKIRTNMGWRHMFRYTVDVEFNVDGKIYREYLWDLVANMNGRWTWDTIASKTLIRPITSGALSLTVTTHLHFVLADPREFVGDECDKSVYVVSRDHYEIEN